MQQPLQITIRDIPHSDALETLIREKSLKLEQFYPRIMGCRVVVEMPHKHKHQGKSFNIRLDITVPGGELVVTKDKHEDVYVALRDAFDAAKRQLEDYGRKQRDINKAAHMPPARGKIMRLFTEEGYGFIEAADGKQLYFNRESLVAMAFEELDVGSTVQYLEEVSGENLQAKRVTMDKHHPVE